MDKWTPDVLFAFCAILSGAGSIGGDMSSPKRVGFFIIIGHAITYASLGAGAAIFVNEYVCKNPAVAIATALLVGSKAIKLKDITEIIRRVFNINVKPDRHDPPDEN